MLWIYSYSIKVCAGFLWDQMGPVKAFPAFAAYQSEFLAGHKFMLTCFQHMCNNKLNPYIFFWNIIYIKSYLSFVIMS